MIHTVDLVSVLALQIVVPGFLLLHVLDQRHLLEEEGVADAGDLLDPRPAGRRATTAKEPRK